jgi:hypothetical protein
MFVGQSVGHVSFSTFFIHSVPVRPQIYMFFSIPLVVINYCLLSSKCVTMSCVVCYDVLSAEYQHL